MTVDELIEKGQEHQAQGENAEAVDAYLRAFELAPKDWRLPSEVGRICLYMLSDAKRAAAAYEAALPILEDELVARETRYHLGVAHTFLEDDARASARFEEVLAHTPTHVLACIELGKLLTRTGDHARAKDLLQQAVLHNNMRSTLPEMFPDGQRGSVHAAALAWMNLGRLAIATASEEDAENAARHLLEDLGDGTRVLKLAEEARGAEEPDVALAAIGQLLARRPSDEEEADRYEKAASLWFRITLDDYGVFDAIVEQAAGTVEGDLEWATRLVDEVLARRPDHEAARALRARLPTR